MHLALPTFCMQYHLGLPRTDPNKYVTQPTIIIHIAHPKEMSSVPPTRATTMAAVGFRAHNNYAGRPEICL